MSTKKQPLIPVAMTIAGSDSGGGAGVQADLNTFCKLGVMGTTAITCITAQNPDEVTDIEEVSPAMVSRQIKTVTSYFRVAAAKTGMLYSTQIVSAVVSALKQCRIKMLVVDPLMIATSGTRLLKKDAVNALCSSLLPLASVITPNIDEAELLSGCRIKSVDDMKKAALQISKKFSTACLVKGGHLEGSSEPGRDEVADVLSWQGRTFVFNLPRLKVTNSHGTGCILSAALTAFLARGSALPDAVHGAKLYVHRKLRD